MRKKYIFEVFKVSDDDQKLITVEYVTFTYQEYTDAIDKLPRNNKVGFSLIRYAEGRWGKEYPNCFFHQVDRIPKRFKKDKDN